MPAKKTADEVIDEFEDMEFDEADYSDAVVDITPVEAVEEVEDLGAVEVPVPTPPTPPQDLATTTTQNFFGGPGNTADIEDLGVQVVTPDSQTFQVSVVEDIGPVFYGMKVIEMFKGRLYNVTEDVYQYLYSRGKLVGQ